MRPDMSEDELFALRTLCLIRLRVIDQEEEMRQIVDRYGEGDDEVIKLLIDYWELLAGFTKEQVVREYRFFSKIEALAHNKPEP
jgi:hypothetical protein